MIERNYILLEELDIDIFLSSGFVFQLPGTEDILLGQGLRLCDAGSEDFFQVNFYHTQELCYNAKTLCLTKLDLFLDYIDNKFSQKLKLELVHFNLKDYQEDVEQSLIWIKNTKIEKLVNVSTTNYKSTNGTIHPVSQARKLANLNGYLYGIWTSSDSGMIGRTPEPLLIGGSGQWNTTALAGTISTSVANYQTVINNDLKELKEHNLVIDDLREKISKFSQSITIKKTSCFNFGPIAHLRTEMSFKNNRDDIFTLIKGLGPSAALGGYPSTECKQYLNKLNYYRDAKENRLFGGIYGIKQGLKYYSLVGIRNLYWKNNTYFIHSGSGIVLGSSVERETDEVMRKRDAIGSAFNE